MVAGAGEEPGAGQRPYPTDEVDPAEEVRGARAAGAASGGLAGAQQVFVVLSAANGQGGGVEGGSELRSGGEPVGVAQAVLDEADIRAELPDVPGPKRVDFEFDDAIAQLLDMEQEQVDNEVVDVEADLPPH